jgi:hypothetical protein
MHLSSHLRCNIREFSGDRASIACSDRLHFILHGPYTLGLKSASALKQGGNYIKLQKKDSAGISRVYGRVRDRHVKLTILVTCSSPGAPKAQLSMWIVTYQRHYCFKYYEYSHRTADSRISLGLGTDGESDQTETHIIST